MDNFGQPMQSNYSQPQEAAGGYANQQAGVGYQSQPSMLDQLAPQQAPASWRDSLAEDLRSNPNLTKFDSIEKLAQGYINASSLVGRRISDIPADQLKQMFSPEEMAGFYKGMGVPESPDQYQVSALPEHLMQNPLIKENVQKAQQLAHKLGIPGDAFNEIVKLEMEMGESNRLQQQQANLAELNNIYGRDLTKANDVATKAVLSIGGEKLYNKLVQSGAASDPDVFQALYKIGLSMQQDRIPTQAFGNPGVNPNEIKEQIQSLYQDREFYSKFKENDPIARDKINALYQRLQQFDQRR